MEKLVRVEADTIMVEAVLVRSTCFFEAGSLKKVVYEQWEREALAFSLAFNVLKEQIWPGVKRSLHVNALISKRILQYMVDLGSYYTCWIPSFCRGVIMRLTKSPRLSGMHVVGTGIVWTLHREHEKH